MDNGADCNIVNQEGKSATDYTLRENEMNILHKLIAHGANAEKVLENFGFVTNPTAMNLVKKQHTHSIA